ncbi:unnamed protein product [Amoebophrya sp. A25]|nr:unnamed protein product [Amoebophrya sp. A25]|eukprot:GSA25T00001843001.1
MSWFATIMRWPPWAIPLLHGVFVVLTLVPSSSRWRAHAASAAEEPFPSRVVNMPVGVGGSPVVSQQGHDAVESLEQWGTSFRKTSSSRRGMSAALDGTGSGVEDDTTSYNHTAGTNVADRTSPFPSMLPPLADPKTTRSAGDEEVLEEVLLIIGLTVLFLGLVALFCWCEHRAVKAHSHEEAARRRSVVAKNANSGNRARAEGSSAGDASFSVDAALARQGAPGIDEEQSDDGIPLSVHLNDAFLSAAFEHEAVLEAERRSRAEHRANQRGEDGARPNNRMLTEEEIRRYNGTGQEQGPQQLMIEADPSSRARANEKDQAIVLMDPQYQGQQALLRPSTTSSLGGGKWIATPRWSRLSQESSMSQKGGLCMTPGMYPQGSDFFAYANLAPDEDDALLRKAQLASLEEACRGGYAPDSSYENAAVGAGATATGPTLIGYDEQNNGGNNYKDSVNLDTETREIILGTNQAASQQDINTQGQGSQNAEQASERKLSSTEIVAEVLASRGGHSISSAPESSQTNERHSFSSSSGLRISGERPPTIPEEPQGSPNSDVSLRASIVHQTNHLVRSEGGAMPAKRREVFDSEDENEKQAEKGQVMKSQIPAEELHDESRSLQETTTRKGLSSSSYSNAAGVQPTAIGKRAMREVDDIVPGTFSEPLPHAVKKDVLSIDDAGEVQQERRLRELLAETVQSPIGTALFGLYGEAVIVSPPGSSRPSFTSVSGGPLDANPGASTPMSPMASYLTSTQSAHQARRSSLKWQQQTDEMLARALAELEEEDGGDGEEHQTTAATISDALIGPSSTTIYEKGNILTLRVPSGQAEYEKAPEVLEDNDDPLVRRYDGVIPLPSYRPSFSHESARAGASVLEDARSWTLVKRELAVNRAVRRYVEGGDALVAIARSKLKVEETRALTDVSRPADVRRMGEGEAVLAIEDAQQEEEELERVRLLSLTDADGRNAEEDKVKGRGDFLSLSRDPTAGSSGLDRSKLEALKDDHPAQESSSSSSSASDSSSCGMMEDHQSGDFDETPTTTYSPTAPQGRSLLPQQPPKEKMSSHVHDKSIRLQNRQKTSALLGEATIPALLDESQLSKQLAHKGSTILADQTLETQPPRQTECIVSLEESSQRRSEVRHSSETQPELVELAQNDKPTSSGPEEADTVKGLGATSSAAGSGLEVPSAPEGRPSADDHELAPAATALGRGLVNAVFAVSDVINFALTTNDENNVDQPRTLDERKEEEPEEVLATTSEPIMDNAANKMLKPLTRLRSRSIMGKLNESPDPGLAHQELSPGSTSQSLPPTYPELQIPVQVSSASSLPRERSASSRDGSQHSPASEDRKASSSMGATQMLNNALLSVARAPQDIVSMFRGQQQDGGVTSNNAQRGLEDFLDDSQSEIVAHRSESLEPLDVSAFTGNFLVDSETHRRTANENSIGSLGINTTDLLYTQTQSNTDEEQQKTSRKIQGPNLRRATRGPLFNLASAVGDTDDVDILGEWSSPESVSRDPLDAAPSRPSETRKEADTDGAPSRPAITFFANPSQEQKSRSSYRRSIQLGDVLDVRVPDFASYTRAPPRQRRNTRGTLVQQDPTVVEDVPVGKPLGQTFSTVENNGTTISIAPAATIISAQMDESTSSKSSDAFSEDSATKINAQDERQDARMMESSLPMVSGDRRVPDPQEQLHPAGFTGERSLQPTSGNDGTALHRRQVEHIASSDSPAHIPTEGSTRREGLNSGTESDAVGLVSARGTSAEEAGSSSSFASNLVLGSAAAPDPEVESEMLSAESRSLNGDDTEDVDLS